MSISYRTSDISDDSFQVIIPATKQQILAMNQILVPNSFKSFAPIRNHHTFGVLCHDSSHDFYFNPNYDYDTSSIIEYEQVVINGDGSGSGDGCNCDGLYWEDLLDSEEEGTVINKDKFSIFSVDESNRTLNINYNTVNSVANNIFSIFSADSNDNRQLNINYSS